MYFVKKHHTGFALWTAVLLLMVSKAAAQPFEYIWDGGSGPTNNFWDLGPNWNVGTSGQANNVVPYAFFQETGLIGLVSGAPVTVNVRTFQDTLGTSGSTPAANRRSVAGVNVTNGSTLNIQGAGRLVVQVTHGPNGATTGLPTPGTGNAAINSGGAITIQSPTVATGGQLIAEDNIEVNSGTLTVMPGALASAQNINSGATGAIVLSGNAMLNSTGSTTLGGRTTITGPGATFNSGRVVMTDSTIFNPVITGASHSIMNVTSTVTMNGTLRPQFQSVTPSLGNTWVIWDSSNTLGAFDVSDDSLTPLPQGHRYAVITTTVGSVNGTRGLLTVENFLTAEVNRANGQVTFRNTASIGGVTINGYQITSAAGALNPGGFTSSFADDGFDGGAWLEANPNANSIGELNPGGNSLIATSSSNPLGSIYDPVSTLQQFGNPVPEDLVFTYRRSDGRVVTGAVAYTNVGVANTLVLQVDPTDGKARIINNSPFNVSFDSYRVRSSQNLNSLNIGWNSLDDQNVGGAGAWLEAEPTANALSELNPLGSLAVSTGATAAVMTDLYDFATDNRDLVFDFRVPPGGGLPNGGVLNGVVRYAPFNVGALAGDYNNNGVVDAADYVLWRNGGPLANDPTPGAQPGDYGVWRSNFGAVLGSGAAVQDVSSTVPEPSTLVLATSLFFGLLVGRRCRSVRACS